jgi:hypothetical protein
VEPSSPSGLLHMPVLAEEDATPYKSRAIFVISVKHLQYLYMCCGSEVVLFSNSGCIAGEQKMSDTPSNVLPWVAATHDSVMPCLYLQPQRLLVVHVLFF